MDTKTSKKGLIEKLDKENDVRLKLIVIALKTTATIDAALFNYKKELGETTENRLPSGLDGTLKDVYEKVRDTLISVNALTLKYYNKTKWKENKSKPEELPPSEYFYGQDRTNH